MIQINRDKNKKIISYYFEFKYKNGHKSYSLFKKTLSREDVENIYQSYTFYGANLSKEFISNKIKIHHRALCGIIKELGLTKSSLPFPAHQLEEMSADEIEEKLYKAKLNKCNEIYEKELLKSNNALNNQLAQEIFQLKNQLNDQKTILNGLDLSSLPKWKPKVQYNKNKKHIVIWLSDMHIGACNGNSESPYQKTEYNASIISERLSKIVYFIQSNINDFNEITIVNLGDAIDGINNTTSRCEGKFLPQNMGNKEMIRSYIDLMSGFFRVLCDSNLKVNFKSVIESNHGGYTEYAATLALVEILKQYGVNCEMAENSFGKFFINDWKIVYMHGKDSKNQFKPFPNIINDKTANYINEWLIEENISKGKILIVKGDQHRSALTSTNTFEYKGVSSLYGSSDWIKSNFGNTKWGCDYSIFDNFGNRMDGKICD